MRIADGRWTVEQAEGADAERAAAGIWARATARRDGVPVVPLEEKLVGVRNSSTADGASLHLARRGPRVAGFCLLVPRGDSLEVRYLAVDPGDWGSGAGRALLGHVDGHARRTGFSCGELWVIADNARAVGVYERAGWVATDVVEVRGSPGRAERRLVRTFD